MGREDEVDWLWGPTPSRGLALHRGVRFSAAENCGEHNVQGPSVCNADADLQSSNATLCTTMESVLALVHHTAA